MEVKGNEKSDFTLNVMASDDGDVHGTIQHCESGETKDFRSLIELVLLINEKLDQLKFLKPTEQVRSWNIRRILRNLKGGRVL
jgi:predicted transcriptional regulator with HTH domain